jgi:hypothetical protein
MKRTISLLAVSAALLVTAMPLLAQQKRMSPHETISQVVDGNRVSIVYGRPYTKRPNTDTVRKIWGGLVPYGKVWRTGADEATLFVTQKPIVVGDTTIPAGAYTLFTLPQEDGTAKLIFSKDIGQWGEEYKDGNDQARVDLKKTALDTPVDEFTMTVVKNDNGGIIKMSWEKAEYSVPFTVQK